MQTITMTYLCKIEAKIFADANSFSPVLFEWKINNLTIVFTNGCFDLLHRGHVEYLAKAADKADKMVVGLNSDISVKKIKGNSRPLVDQHSRALLLAALECVDAVVVFDEETPAMLIEAIIPDFLVKGNDYRDTEIAGYEFVVENGGRVETIELTRGYSTTDMIERIKKSQ